MQLVDNLLGTLEGRQLTNSIVPDINLLSSLNHIAETTTYNNSEKRKKPYVLFPQLHAITILGYRYHTIHRCAIL